MDGEENERVSGECEQTEKQCATGKRLDRQGDRKRGSPGARESQTEMLAPRSSPPPSPCSIYHACHPPGPLARQRLDLSFNQIRRIEGLKGLTVLRVLDMQANYISRMDDINTLKKSVCAICRPTRRDR